MHEKVAGGTWSVDRTSTTRSSPRALNKTETGEKGRPERRRQWKESIGRAGVTGKSSWRRDFTIERNRSSPAVATLARNERRERKRPETRGEEATAARKNRRWFQVIGKQKGKGEGLWRDGERKENVDGDFFRYFLISGTF
ncbi:hypothetical protein JCGZ_16133 [Jatropha curcas]|uniref:Uncharacterized protein n=1 Tax=Jatropha curcas TaxID=180498 RepID=A0A067K6S5_JATCU|nr:hypothetical protein JCGZ_16133 [Jatropha curcas]